MGEFQANLRARTQVAPPFEGKVSGKAMLIVTALERLLNDVRNSLILLCILSDASSMIASFVLKRYLKRHRRYLLYVQIASLFVNSV